MSTNKGDDQNKSLEATSSAWTEENARAPKSAKAIVQCEAFRCVAFRLLNGDWVDTHGNPLAVIEVIDQL